jgi:hypothetical protein
MDHRWTDWIERERAASAERERRGAREVCEGGRSERRPLAQGRARATRRSSAWDIGAAHWDQRDLYTASARTDDAGYGLGPSVHPPEGSHAYRRAPPPPAPPPEDVAHLYRRAAWPIERLVCSDAALVEDVWDALSSRRDLDASDVDVLSRCGEVTLRGSVPAAPMRRLAGELAAACRGVRRVDNLLCVHDEDAPIFGAFARAW